MPDTPEKPAERPRRSRKQTASDQATARTGEEATDEQAVDSAEAGEEEGPSVAKTSAPPRGRETFEEKPADKEDGPRQKKKDRATEANDKEEAEVPQATTSGKRMRFRRRAHRG